MATQSWQEQRDKLMASDPNLSLIDATRQARTPQTGIVNAPVAGQAPAITPMAETPTAPVAPTTPVNVNAQQRQENIAKRQEQIASGQVPSVGQNPTTGTGVDGVTVDANGNITNTTGKRQKIKNLSGQEFYVGPDEAQKAQSWGTPGYSQGTTTPSGATLDANGNVTPAETPTDTTAQDQAKIQAESQAKMEQEKLKSDLTQKTEAQKTEAMIPKTATDIYNTLVSGGSVAPQKTGAYREAQFKYNQYKKYSAMTPTELVASMKAGRIGSELDSMLANTPNYMQAKMDYENQKKVSTINNNIRSTYSGKVEPEQDPFEKITNDIVAKFGLDSDQTVLSAFQQYVENDPKIREYAQEVSGYSRQINDATQLLNDGIQELKKLKGDMPISSFIVASNSRFSELNNTINSLKGLREVAQADLTMATEMANAKYTAVSQDIAQANQTKNTVIGQLIQSQFSLATKKAEAEMAQEVAREAMNDPYVAIPQMIEEYKKIGVLPPGTTAISLIQEFETSGKDLPSYLESLQKKIAGSPEYKAYQDKLSGAEWQSTSITRYNPSTGANESTPIFYRKKTSGGFEAVDLSGNPIDVSNLTGGGGTSPGTIPSSFTGDTTSYIASKEGFRSEAYQDSGGVWTIGYGTTKINGKPVQPGQTITQEQAQKLLQEDIAKHSNWKNYIDENTLSPSQKTALASFEYNLGPGIWDKSAMNIIDMIKSGDLAGASAEMKKYNTVKGTVVKGLTNRRNEEASLLMDTGTSGGKTSYSPDKIKSFETFDGKSFPSDYKTPAQQKQYRDEYNAWRDSQVSNQIKTGQDIINIRLSDKATADEKNALQYGSRALNAINDLPQYEEVFASLPLKDQLYQTYAPQLLKSDNQKILESRKKDFITAILRKESGASIAESEFQNEEKKYFAQPGDSQAVVIAKQNARNFAIKSLLTGAGQDVNGRSINTLYNPPIIEEKTNNGESIQDRLNRLRKQ